VAEIRALGREAVALQCDLSREAEVRRLVPRAMEAFGGMPIGCVINSAALFDYDSADSFSVAALDAHMHANLAAPILLAQALHAATPDGRCNAVINLLDQKLYNMNPDFLSYTLSKAALDAATTMLAQSLAPKVRVVGVAPGLTLPSHMQTAEDFAATRVLSPLGESSRPEEVASAVAFAVENRALTGSTIVVDAGQHLLPLPRDFSFIKRNE
jgi:NAD(P)-dependent dehydrogenase (short-subunit alcohol dehydrogenase family)